VRTLRELHGSAAGNYVFILEICGAFRCDKIWALEEVTEKVT
jgi:hypothetical protein